MSGIHHFRARIVVEDGDTQEIEVWDEELSPFEGGRRPVRDWVRKHLCGECYSQKNLRELLGIPAEGNYEAVVEGTIRGYQDHWTGEWDEELDLTRIIHQKIPDSWYECMPDSLEILDEDSSDVLDSELDPDCN